MFLICIPNNLYKFITYKLFFNVIFSNIFFISIITNEDLSYDTIDTVRVGVYNNTIFYPQYGSKKSKNKIKIKNKVDIVANDLSKLIT